VDQKQAVVRAIQSAAPTMSLLAPTLAARWLERLFITPTRRPVRAHEQATMAAAEQSWIRFDADRRCPVYSWGRGPVVMLVHGWSGRASQLSHYVDPLIAHGLRVVAFDAPAHGDADGRHSALTEFAALVTLVAEREGTPAAILAHSVGSAAVTIALTRGLAAGRLVYIAPPENPGIYLTRMGQFLRFRPEVVQRTWQRLEQRYKERFVAVRGSLLARTLRTPLLIVHDQADEVVPYAEGSDLAQAWAGAVLLPTQGLGHHRILKDDAVVQAAVQFINGDLPEALSSVVGMVPAGGRV
jgi:pimeloyl-ACP methyl ester carboxylesterase